MTREDTCVVYSNDGSSQSGVGAYVVQSLIINGTPRCLPTTGVFTESRETLPELTKHTLKVLSAASEYKYQDHELLEKIQYWMTDNTSHNLNVIEQVCKDLNVENVPGQLLCNVHPLMLFQKKIKEMCQQIHNELGKQKVSDCLRSILTLKMNHLSLKQLDALPTSSVEIFQQNLVTEAHTSRSSSNQRKTCHYL